MRIEVVDVDSSRPRLRISHYPGRENQRNSFCFDPGNPEISAKVSLMSECELDTLLRRSRKPRVFEGVIRGTQITADSATVLRCLEKIERVSGFFRDALNPEGKFHSVVPKPLQDCLSAYRALFYSRPVRVKGGSVETPQAPRVLEYLLSFQDKGFELEIS